MEPAAKVALILFLGPLVAMIFGVILRIFDLTFFGIFFSVFRFGVTSQERELLIEQIPYYRRLNRDGRKKFEKRVGVFKRIKKFIPIEIKRVTDEMKLLISAAAVQLTFGQRRYFLGHFYKFYIYPTSFEKLRSEHKFRGLTSNRGYMQLSWEHFHHGFEDYEDGRNLGLHELAHALMIESIEQSANYRFFNRLESWKLEAVKIMEDIRNDQDRLLSSLCRHQFRGDVRGNC